jgi:hypothetical protein
MSELWLWVPATLTKSVCTMAQTKLALQAVMTENILSISKVDTKFSLNTLWRFGYMLCAGRNNILIRKSPLVTKQRVSIYWELKSLLGGVGHCCAWHERVPL